MPYEEWREFLEEILDMTAPISGIIGYDRFGWIQY